MRRALDSMAVIRLSHTHIHPHLLTITTYW